MQCGKKRVSAHTNVAHWGEAAPEGRQSMGERVGRLFLAVQHAEMGPTHCCRRPT